MCKAATSTADNSNRSRACRKRRAARCQRIALRRQFRFEALEQRALLAAAIDLSPFTAVHPTEGFGYGSTIEGLGQAFDGRSTSTFVSLELNDPFGINTTGQFTQEAWIYAGSASGRIFGMEDDALVGLDVVNSTSISFAGSVASGVAIDVLNADAWNHAAQTFDGDRYRLYVNGVEVYSQAGALGTVTEGDSIGFNGGAAIDAIDEMRLWNVARSQSDIQRGMLDPLAGDEAGLVGYWQFEGNLSDSSINQNPDGFQGQFAVFMENPAPQIGYVEVEVRSGEVPDVGLWITYDVTPSVSNPAIEGVDFVTSRFRTVSDDPSTEQNGIIINKGETTGRIYFFARPDAIAEPTESFTVRLTEFALDGGVPDYSLLANSTLR